MHVLLYEQKQTNALMITWLVHSALTIPNVLIYTSSYFKFEIPFSTSVTYIFFRYI